MTDTHWSCDLFLLCVWHLCYSAWHATCISRPCALSCYLSPVTGSDAHCVIYYSVVEGWGHDSKYGDCDVLYILCVCMCVWEREMEKVREWGKMWQGLCCQCDSFLFLYETWVCTCTFVCHVSLSGCVLHAGTQKRKSGRRLGRFGRCWWRKRES